jgi:hypothetical protein
MATRMQIVRHLPNDTASRKIGFTLTDEQAQAVVDTLDVAQKKKDANETAPYFFKFMDDKTVVHYYPLHLILYVSFESNYEPPVVEKVEKEAKEGE